MWRHRGVHLSHTLIFVGERNAGRLGKFAGNKGGGFSAAAEAEFAEDLADMVFGRLGADDEALGDLTIGQALCQQFQHLYLALGEFGTQLWAWAGSNTHLA
jgi:hypothetical protein